MLKAEIRPEFIDTVYENCTFVKFEQGKLTLFGGEVIIVYDAKISKTIYVNVDPQMYVACVDLFATNYSYVSVSRREIPLSHLHSITHSTVRHDIKTANDITRAILGVDCLTYQYVDV